MRSPTKTITNRSVRDAESELNLPPGFRFHPTDEELIVHYLCRKSQSTSGTAASTVPPPLSIIADIDLYKHEPWELPEMALFGTKEWYFFTPRDKKYPNGSRPNRVTGNGYWKATGADKPIKSKSDPNTTVGIKKALVFYSGKGTKGIKTNWIMHEYRLITNSLATTSSNNKLDDWVLCRLYNKKNNPKEMIIPKDAKTTHDTTTTLPTLILSDDQLQIKGTSYSSNNSDSLNNSFEYCSDDGFSGSLEGDVISHESTHNQPLTTKVQGTSHMAGVVTGNLDENGNDWFDSLSLEDLHNCLEAMPPNNHDYICEMPMFYSSPNQQHFPQWDFDHFRIFKC